MSFYELNAKEWKSMLLAIIETENMVLDKKLSDMEYEAVWNNPSISNYGHTAPVTTQFLHVEFNSKLKAKSLSLIIKYKAQYQKLYRLLKNKKSFKHNTT